jgi:cytochrome b subunit of formate dehydrogenase
VEILRTATNPWGQAILVGVAWDLIWAALFAGVLFVVGHALFVQLLAPPKGGEAATAVPGVPERVERHSGASRGFHWLMAISMFVLLVTAFFPVVGIRFPWVTIHWIAGVALMLLVLFHIWHALVKQDMRTMRFGVAELKRGARMLGGIMRREPDAKPRGGKYPLDQRMYHHAATVVTLGAIITGVLMMLRIDTWFWASNPYFLADSTWGLVFVLHGLCGVALITLVIAHVYFAVRPEKRWMTRSMIKGWITHEEYFKNYDPDQWAVGGEAQARVDAPSSDRPSDPGAVAPA